MYSLLNRFRSSQNTWLLGLSVVVGLTTGLLVWLFSTAIELFHALFTEIAHQVDPALGSLSIVLSLALAGLLVGALMDTFVGEERHHGVTGIMEAVALTGGRLRYFRMPYKAIASALSLGAGASVGPEDPSVQIGANLGSFLGQRLSLSEDHVRLLVAAGAASAIAAVFKAPIAGVFFALEVILNGSLTTASIGVVILAAVAASAFTQAIEPAAEMGPFTYQLGSPAEVILFVPLGLLLAPIAVVFIRSVYWQHDLWHHYVHLPRPLKTALAGAMVGAVGILLPEIMGTGRETMNGVLSGEAQFTLLMLVTLGIVKILATSTSMAGGFVGGIFAPTLFVGTMLGDAYGKIIEVGFGHRMGDPQAYAIAGMAAVMAGAVRSPITAIMMVFELTNDYRLILPIMLSTMVCVYISERLEPAGIYILGLKRQGIHLQQGTDVDLMQSVTVREAMRTPAPTIFADADLLAVRDAFREKKSLSLCVVNSENQLQGIVTLSDLQRAYDNEENTTAKVSDICTREVITTTPEEAVWTAIRRMSAHDIGRLPVVERGTQNVVGLLGRHGIVRAYNIAISHKLENQHAAERIRLHTLTGAHVYELKIAPQAPIANQHIRDVHFPAESSVASVQRHGKLIIPHGSTELKAGDLLTIVADPNVESELKKLVGYKV